MSFANNFTNSIPLLFSFFQVFFKKLLDMVKILYFRMILKIFPLLFEIYYQFNYLLSYFFFSITKKSLYYPMLYKKLILCKIPYFSHFHILTVCLFFQLYVDLINISSYFLFVLKSDQHLRCTNYLY